MRLAGQVAIPAGPARFQRTSKTTSRLWFRREKTEKRPVCVVKRRRPRLIALSHDCTASDSHSCRSELAFICDADIFDTHEQLWVACTVEQCSPHAATTCTSTLGGRHTKQTTCNATDNNLCHCCALSTSCNLAVSRVCILFGCSAPPLPIVVGSPSAALGTSWPQVVSLPSS